MVPLGDVAMRGSVAANRRLEELAKKGEPLTAGEADELRAQLDEERAQALAWQGQAQKWRQEMLQTDSLYGRMKDIPVRLIPARVVAAGTLGYGQTRLINAGTSDSAVPGAAVTTRTLLTDRSKALPDGLLALADSVLAGRIVDAGPFSATLQLVVDKNFKAHASVLRVLDPKKPRTITTTDVGSAAKVPLTDENNRLIDVQAQGDGHELLVHNVSMMYNVAPGDWLLSDPDEPLLPAAVRIGQVERVEPEPTNAHFVCLHIKPFLNADCLREVYVVVHMAAATE